LNHPAAKEDRQNEECRMNTNREPEKRKIEKPESVVVVMPSGNANG